MILLVRDLAGWNRTSSPIHSPQSSEHVHTLGILCHPSIEGDVFDTVL